jgi:hypothetical protein
MSQVEIEVAGPIMENLARIEVWDREASDSVHVDYADYEKARSEGVQEILTLIIENSNSVIYDILDAAIVNGTAVTLDGGPVDLVTLAAAFERDTGSLVAQPGPSV